MLATLRLSTALVLSAIATTPLHAADLLVPAQFRTIQAAVNAAADGDTILIAPGTYNETVFIQAKAVSLIGVEGPDKTILDGTGLTGPFNSPTGLISVSGPTPGLVRLEGLSIQNGTGFELGGGGLQILTATADVVNCIVRKNSISSTPWSQQTRGGGAYQDYKAVVYWTDCDFIENVCAGTGNAPVTGGGVHVGHFFHSPHPSGSATFTRCNFVHNRVEKAWGSTQTTGGAAFSSYGSTFIDCHFEANECVGSFQTYDFSSSAGVFSRGLSTLQGCTFINHNFRAVMFDALGTQSQVAVVSDCVFIGNSTPSFGGGAIFAFGYSSPPMTVEISNSWFVSNTAKIDGGAVLSSGTPETTVSTCTFVNNHAGNGGGGVALLTNNLQRGDKVTHTVADCVFQGNSGGMSSGALGIIGDALLTNSTFSDNHVARWGGGAIGLFQKESDITIDHCTITGNEAPELGGGIFAHFDPVVTLTSTTLCSNAPDDIAGPWIDGGDNTLCDNIPSADLNTDGAVNGLDLGLLLGAWGEPRSPADLNSDATVDAADLALLLAAWTG